VSEGHSSSVAGQINNLCRCVADAANFCELLT